MAILWSYDCGDPMELYSMPTPEGSNHHSHENPTFFHDPEGVIYSAVSSAVALILRVNALLSERSRGEKPILTFPFAPSFSRMFFPFLFPLFFSCCLVTSFSVLDCVFFVKCCFVSSCLPLKTLQSSHRLSSFRFR